MTGADTLTVIIPAFNEAAGIAGVLDELTRECGDFLTTVIVVDDGSSDETARLARERGAVVVQHPVNLGYGASLKSGLRQAETSHVATFDADGQHRAADLRRLWDARANAAMVIGARQQLIHSPL